MSDQKQEPRSDADVKKTLEFVDGALGAAGHRLDAGTDPYGRELLERVARGEITADEAVRLSDEQLGVTTRS